MPGSLRQPGLRLPAGHFPKRPGLGPVLLVSSEYTGKAWPGEGEVVGVTPCSQHLLLESTSWLEVEGCS